MIKLKRWEDNPILLPSSKNNWESEAAFNACVIKDKEIFRMVYRAISNEVNYRGYNMQISTIGYSESRDGANFTTHKQLIAPSEEWEIFGCEDPRITKIDNKYLIFYTALSNYPFNKDCIKVGLAITSDLKNFEKHLVTPFNAKAMSIFPEKINGKYVCVLTANTDIPPSKIGIAYFESLQDVWDSEYWKSWYGKLDSHTLPLQRNKNDQVEVGAPPVATKNGWLLIYSYIKNYFSDSRIFSIEAVLLDRQNPMKILGRSHAPLLIPQANFELYGNVPNVVFPTGALVNSQQLYVYYGGADTVCGLATIDLDELIYGLVMNPSPKLERFSGNPIIKPNKSHSWESKATFNPAAIYIDRKIHIIYRAMSSDNTSVFGYASSSDGFHITERLNKPIYTPNERFEMKTKDMVGSGCEDPRITKIGDSLYICYTAYDGVNPPSVALTSIKLNDFLNKNWKFDKPKIISPPNIDDKDACILPRKINGKFVIFHRIESKIMIDIRSDLDFDNNYLSGEVLIEPESDHWHSKKVGIGPPPLETEFGWLMLYHGVDDNYSYKVGAAILDKEDPTHILFKTEMPILEPIEPYEKEGEVPNVVFPCGMVEINDVLYVYYGGADKVVCVATISKAKLVSRLVAKQTDLTNV